ncbi:MAG: hypothetical protein QNI91_09080 [Arenicellales bacterium]|nr:hypothetical protein [Arenicellales bacterium]
MFKSEDLYRKPNQLAQYYQRFRVGERLLFTGHSHQAWPDCGFDGQKQAWLDAAQYVDDKWERAFAKAERVREGYARLLDDDNGYYALASNTHDLVVRFLSALPLRRRPRIVTTDGEYHSIRRQLGRLNEEGIDLVKVAAHPAATASQRLIDAVNDQTAAVLVSSVYYQTAHIVPELKEVLNACMRVGAELLVDVYHALNAVPYSLRENGLDHAFVIGGGYKYCQLGEGNCFLRFPKECTMRPIITGWFSEFSALAEAKTGNDTVYGKGADRFAGSTYDPTSHYRAAEVFDFFDKNQLTPEFLRQISQHQVGLLISLFDEAGFDPKTIKRDRSVGLEQIGGFLALRTSHAEKFFTRLHQIGVLTDYRAELLRLGPAPYLCDEQLSQCMGYLSEVVHSL